jgi:hypothetical protein
MHLPAAKSLLRRLVTYLCYVGRTSSFAFGPGRG